jgi:hypothetical protein
MADIDGILERLVTDQGFRAQLASDPAAALDGYDLSADDLALLASSMDEGDVGQRGVEQRTSKSAVVGLLASLTGGGGGHGGGGKAQASDIFAKTGGSDQGNLLAPTGQGGSAQASDIFAKIGDIKMGNLDAPGGGDPSHAAVDMFSPGEIKLGNLASGGGDPAHAAVDMFSPGEIKMGNLSPDAVVAPIDSQGGSAAIGDIKGVGNSGPAMDAPNLKIGPVTDASNLKIGPAGGLSPEYFDNTAPADLNMSPSVSEAPGISDGGGAGTKGILIGLNQGDAGVNGDGAPAGIQPWNGDSAKGIDIPALKAGPTSADSPAELMGLLQPPTGENAKGIDVPAIKLGNASVDAFLEIDDA